jgi:DNA-binding MarR family transcriptional regulator
MTEDAPLAELMRGPLAALDRRVLRDARVAGFSDLVAAHLAVLHHPGPDGRRPSELADAAGMTKQALNYLLGQLEELGYLTREADRLGDDRRSKRVYLTERGEALRRTIRASVTATEARLEAELGPKDHRQLRRLLARLGATDPADPGPSVPAA